MSNRTCDPSRLVSDRTADEAVRSPANGLDAFFRPTSIAVVGASDKPGQLGNVVFRNLIESGFRGRLDAVNVRQCEVLGHQTVASLRQLEQAPDLVVIAIPAAAVEAVIDDCVAIGTRAAVILSAGFDQPGPDAGQMTARILRKAQKAGLRLIGPNCLGVLCPAARLNASFASTMPRPGRLAFLSQSGALCTAILDWSRSENIGFSGFASVGSMLDVNWADLINYFGEDPETDCILAYIESIGDARSFLSAARKVALSKPIIVLKGGRTAAAAAAAVSHSGALACHDDVFDAAMRRVGILRVLDLSDLFHVAELLSKQPRPNGRRLTVVTNAGGPGILATDTLVEGRGQLAELPVDLKHELDQVLPPFWSHGNPIDIGGDADPERFAAAVQIANRNPESDGLLMLLTPQAMTAPSRTVERVLPLLRDSTRPVLACWMGGEMVTEATRLLNQADIPTFDYPESAARAFNHSWHYQEQLRNLYETPSPGGGFESIEGRRSAVSAILNDALASGRTLLTEEESKRVLRAYGIPTTPTFVANTAEDAVRRARGLGFPVVLKLHSTSITHKAKVGGVCLDLRSPEEVRQAFDRIHQALKSQGLGDHFQGVSVQPFTTHAGIELLVGAFYDAQFGPCVLFGSGGKMAETFRDYAVGLPPLNSTLARRLIEQTKVASALQAGDHEPACNAAELERMIVAVGDLLVEQPRIRELDINPLIATPTETTALDARIVLHASLDDIRPPAIRPYPLEYVRSATLENGTLIRLRPIRLEDETAMVEFHKTLSEDTIRHRYFGLTSLSGRMHHERLLRHCLNDFECQAAIVAESVESNAILGVGRLSREWRSPSAELSLVVADAWQHRGIGRLLLDHLITIGRLEGVQRLTATMLSDNSAMRELCLDQSFAFSASRSNPGVMHFERSIIPAELKARDEIIL